MDPPLTVSTPSPLQRPKQRVFSRALDALAILVVLFALWKIFLAPRLFSRAETAVLAPPVALPTLDGPRFDSLSHRGSVVFLDFWASWCGPCKLSIPLVAQYAAAHPEVTVVSVNAGESIDVATRYAREHKMRGVAFDADLAGAHAFGIDGYPTMIVLDPQGRVRGKWVGFNPLIGSAMENARKTFTR